MPHLPTEEQAESNIFDKVAKSDPSSGASDHPLHDKVDDVADAANATKDKGPQISDKMPDVEGTKGELKAKANEMNM